MFNKILVVNDDSINSSLLFPLVKVLKRYGNELLVVVPHNNQSACSQTINIRKALTLYEENNICDDIKTYSVDGSPADCVKIAREVLNFDFDLVVSGINDGYNLADDICYSGTVGGASEAEFFSKKGLAVSIERGKTGGLNYLNEAIDYVLKKQLFAKTNLVNINIPENALGIKETVQGKRRFNGTFVKTPEGTYMAVNKQTINKEEPFFIIRDDNKLSDFTAIEEGYISITPFTTDKTK